MIDPKLNEVPADRGTTGREAAAPADAQSEQARRARAGLSIRDTVAGDTMLSVGSRGVDVSGVESGAGSGSGSTMITPGNSGSPAPNVVPGGRATGTTPRGSSASGRSPAATAPSQADTPGITGDADTAAYANEHSLSDEEISSRAYECWCERGCPHGSPEVDWHRAINDLRERRRSTSLAGTTRSSAASA